MWLSTRKESTPDSAIASLGGESGLCSLYANQGLTCLLLRLPGAAMASATEIARMEGHALKNLLAVAALALALPAAASAATFTGTFNVTGSALADPGLVVRTAANTNPYGFDLDDGESTSVNLFRIWTDEVAVNDDDRQHSMVDVNFDVNGATGTLSGASYGANGGLFNLFEGGSVDWANPLALDVGTGTLTVRLFSSLLSSSTDFNWGFIDPAEGYKHGADVYANFSYEAAPVPLPAGLALILSGLGALGFFGTRRKAIA